MPDDTDQLRQLLALETSRLRAVAGEPEYRRREALVDLGSRLAAIGASSTDPRWHDLLQLLRPDRLAAEPLADLWSEVLALLDALIGNTSGSDSAPPRTSFWKRSRGH